MISVEEALERILAEISPLTVTHVPLPGSLGFVLAEDVIAQEDIPPFANSAMDGFALLSQDSQPRGGQPPRLRVTEIGPWEIGVLATLGWASVPVIRRPRVAVLGTGDEVIDVDEPLRPGKIRNSNSYLLEAAVQQAGAEPQRLGVASDTVESL